MSKGGLTTALLLFLAVLVILFYGVFLPDQTLASNDGPLGRLMSACHRLPGRFLGCWADLNNVGFDAGAAAPGISFGLQWLLGPVWFSKFYAIISLLILGAGAWCFFRQSRLAPLACILGGLAMILNSSFFSVACWGVCAHDIAAGMFFFALAALVDTASPYRWLLVILAGFAVGMDVTEGADVGAIFSVLVAFFVLYQSFTAQGSRLKNITAGAGRLILVVVCAGLLAAQAIYGLVSTSIAGVAGAQQDAQTKANRWDWATQWSLPKTETLGLVVPGLFGYRLDTPNGGEYWGITGRTPAWAKYLAGDQQGRPPSSGFARYTGGGNYLGVLVALIALWTAAQSLRPKNSIFGLAQKKWLWFWLTIAVVSLLLSWGRFAPFYRLVYALPYFSTIRNPTKFLYVLGFAVSILFAYGIDGLWRKYMLSPAIADQHRWAGFGRWWSKTSRFDKNWVYGCAIVWVLGLAAWYLYYQHLPQLERYLQTQHLDQPVNAVAQFSISQPIWFAVFFLVSAGLLVLILSGAFTGKRARTGAILLGLVLIADLAPANRPWIVFWNYQYKYASNPVIDLLRQNPYDHRAVLVPIAWPSQMTIFHTLYKTEWMEQQFPYYDVQTFDVVEMPRVPEDFSAFSKLLNENAGSDASIFRYSRGYQLTNTRYLLGPANFAEFWNSKVPTAPIQSVLRFNVAVKPGTLQATNVDQLTAVADNYGRYAVFELPSALPRAKLYTHWQVIADSTNLLHEMFSPAFDPQTRVLVAGDVPENSGTNVANPPDDAVQIVSYAPKDVVLKADATAPSILVLNSHIHPDWKAFVDGVPQNILRCNFLMRGVYLQPGTHTVEFKFRPFVGLLYVSLAAIVAALAAVGVLIIILVKTRPPVAVPVAPIPVLSSAQITSRKTKSTAKKAQRK